MMLNADKGQRREKLVVAGLALLIFGAENSRPADWVRPTMAGETKHPAQALMLGIEAIKFAARPYARDTSKGGSPEWDADLRWLRGFMAKVWAAAPEHTAGLHQCLGTLAALALELTDREVMLPADTEISTALRLLAEVRDLMAPAGEAPSFQAAIRAICAEANLFLPAEAEGVLQ